MKERPIILLIIGLVLLFSGCIPSLHPLYNDDDKICLDEILGSWQSQGKGSEYYDFTKNPNDSASYLLSYLELPQVGFVSRDSSKARFEINIIELSDKYFMDFYPGDNESLDNLNDLLIVHLLATHTFAKLEVSQDTMLIWRLDPNWLEELFDKNKIRIAHEVVDDQIILTASTRDLQAFVSKYADDAKAYIDPEVLIKKK